MSELITVYSYSGNSKKLATEEASKNGLDIIEVFDKEKVGKATAYSKGCLYAMKQKGWDIDVKNISFDEYSKITIYAPNWAGSLAPAAITFLNTIPAGKEISIKLVSKSGVSGCKDKLKTIIEHNGSTMVSFEDIKA
ncbi:MAG: hypothetical protein LBN09_06735 [Clostridioides sp.]|jgi:hypothetical protein|nr:hypothetical protein [Clostridioides sp.]